MRTPMIEARDASIYTRIYGPKAQPVILVHGGPGMPGPTKSLGWLLQDRWRVIDYHQRGAGRSRSVGPAAVNAHVEDLRAVLRATCGDESPILIGCSFGAVITLCFCATHPGWVKKAILVGITGQTRVLAGELAPEERKRLGGRAARKAAKLTKALAGEELEPERDRIFEQIWETLFPLYRCSPDTERPELSACSFAAHRAGLKDAEALRRGGGLHTDYDKITIPVVAFHGDHDRGPAAEARAELEGLLVNFRYLGLTNCGRFPWLEPHAKALFLRALREQMSE